jgi:hypothetical protein
MVVEGLPTIRDKLDRTDEFGDDAKAEKPLGSEDVLGGCSRVTTCHQFAGDIDDAWLVGLSESSPPYQVESLRKFSAAEQIQADREQSLPRCAVKY